MNKTLTKLIMAALALVLAVSVAVMATYAWTILSKSPAAEGIQINIGGGNTILIAPDITQTVDGSTYHYPGTFSEKLNFSQLDSYRYLQSLGGLSPVSTANGLDWFLSDSNGYTLDYNLAHANLSENTEELVRGHYIYLDFWVVSPDSDYTLRVSSDSNSGSFAIDLMEVSALADGGYELSNNTQGAATASVRVGFLTDQTPATEAYSYYQNSQYARGQYTQLKGLFGSDRENYSFYIYEPNGDYHPNTDVAQPGSYVITQPMGLIDGEISQTDIQDCLSVQLTNRWSESDNGSSELAERFQTAIAGRDMSGKTAEELETFFYTEYLQNQVGAYVESADFIKSTDILYRAATAGTVNANALSALTTAGATEDAYIIKLEKNVPQRVRMFIWLEGQDVDCASSAFADSFALSLELAGGST